MLLIFVIHIISIPPHFSIHHRADALLSACSQVMEYIKCARRLSRDLFCFSYLPTTCLFFILTAYKSVTLTSIIKCCRELIIKWRIGQHHEIGFSQRNNNSVMRIVFLPFINLSSCHFPPNPVWIFTAGVF